MASHCAVTSSRAVRERRFPVDRPDWYRGRLARRVQSSTFLRQHNHVMDSDRPDDAELVAAVLAGDREAFSPPLARWQAALGPSAEGRIRTSSCRGPMTL
jgi:hypothetical protein